jgi:hypothetical protein
LVGIGVDNTVTVVTYKDKTVQKALSDLAALLVLTRILTLLLSIFNEWNFNRKMMKETDEEFKEIFTYSNFKRTMVEV